MHDEWLAIIAASTGGVALIREPLIGYRQHGGNVIGARKLGLRQKAGRLSESRADRNARLLARADHYLQRVEALGLPERVRSLARGKLEHERMRSGLPAARVARGSRECSAQRCAGAIAASAAERWMCCATSCSRPDPELPGPAR